MRIAIVYPHFHRRGGIERYLCELVGELAREHEVTLVSGAPEAPLPEGCRSLRVPFVRRPLFLTAITFSFASWLALRGRRFDVVNAHGASCFRQDVVTAHSCHRAWFTRSRRQLAPGSGRWWLKVLNPLHYLTILVERIQLCGGRFRRVIAVSASVKQELMEHYAVPERAISVIHSGVNTREFDPAHRALHRAAVRERHGVGESELLLLFLGNEFRRKGLGKLLEALASGELGEAKLLVAGKDDPAPYRAAAERLGAMERVVFAGPTAEPARLYAAADVFVLPTSYEAFPLVVLEAMASGLPVVTTRTAGAAELIEHGVTGLLLEDPADVEGLVAAILRLRSEEERRAMGRRARERVEAFSWSRVARETIRGFEGLRPAQAAPVEEALP